MFLDSEDPLDPLDAEDPLDPLDAEDPLDPLDAEDPLDPLDAEDPFRNCCSKFNICSDNTKILLNSVVKKKSFLKK
jgi:hypothetical protein